MSDTEITLHPGATGDPETGDGWIPRIALQHEGDRREMFVVVSEEVGGMIEGVPIEAYDGIRARLFTDDELCALHAAVMGGHINAAALDSAATKLDALVGA